MATVAAKGLLHDIATAGQAYEVGDLNARRKLLHLFQELTVELEPPGETFLRVNWAEVRRSFDRRSRIIKSNDLVANASVRDSCRN